MGKPTIWIPTKSDTNQAVQSQKIARSLKYYPLSENEGAVQLRGYREGSAALFSPMQIVGFLMRLSFNEVNG